MSDSIHHTQSATDGRFSLLQANQDVAHIDYVVSGQAMVITHTWVSPQLRGQGVAYRLVLAAKSWAETQSLAVQSQCSYASAVLARL